LTGERSPGRQRIDALIVSRGLAPSRAKAAALVLAGRVRADGRRVDKPGTAVAGEASIEIDPGRAWVGRGGEKLSGVLETLGVDPAGRDAVDVGASTGGFTQVLLAAGAARVAAVDVGRGQLDWSLRNDPRVIVREGINARYLRPDHLPFRPSLAVIDVSFISLTRILDPVSRCLSAEADIVALVKPQFEVGRGGVGKGGIVRDPEAWDAVLVRIVDHARERGLAPRAIARSPIAGAEGNVEFFLHMTPGRPGAPAEVLDALRAEAVHGPARPSR